MVIFLVFLFSLLFPLTVSCCFSAMLKFFSVFFFVSVTGLWCVVTVRVHRMSSAHGSLCWVAGCLFAPIRGSRRQCFRLWCPTLHPFMLRDPWLIFTDTYALCFLPFFLLLMVFSFHSESPWTLLVGLIEWLWTSQALVCLRSSSSLLFWGTALLDTVCLAVKLFPSALCSVMSPASGPTVFLLKNPLIASLGFSFT